MASTPSPALVADTGLGLIYDVVGISLQTLFFGIYTVLVISSSRMLLKRGLKNRAHNVMFILTLSTYLLSSAYWIYSVANVVDRMKVYIDDLQNPINFTASHDALTKWSPLFNAVLLVNYIFSDSVVVWRAWVICWRNYRKYLCITIVFLVLTAGCVVGTIVFRIIALVVSPYAQLPHSSYLVQGINILQISVIGFSLISNISATAVVGATAWRHRRSLRAAFGDNKSTKADQILMLIAESGVLFSLSAVTVLVSSLIRLPHGTLGDIYTPINVQIAGSYPPIVLLFVSMERSLDETTFLNTSETPTPSHSIQFGGSAKNSKEQHHIHFARRSESSMTEIGSDGEMPNLSPDAEMTFAPREKIREDWT
ncbi:hypothetical protein MVEN_00813400 [Mycena venus]|uniref:Uncharacterized protein n=1 Tax=Mycena venus TaxID=2733690 RepID=A0A8H6YAY5_9AGAR|nr:hypothetical protein MVEN_00813400 [Mycena venus]